jgi:Histidine kinase-, DNA gyrase B-, and HSP90-like ATPase
VLSHGLGSALKTNLIFNHPAGQASPWVWSAIHGAAVLAACCGVVIFWETTEREQRKTLELTRQLADAEITRRRFTSDLLVNLARRNQSLLYRQLGLINQLEDQEQDPDALAELFRLDHLATRIRRNAESLLVLSGEEPPRTWGRPVALVDVVRAAIAETEDLDRVVFAVDEQLAVFGNAVADLTHLVAELVENAVHFSPPEARVILRTRPYLQTARAHVLTVEDWGVGMRAEDMAAANELLATPADVDLSVSQRLGLHVVARLAQRHGIQVSLTPTPGCGVTAAVVLPPSLFSDADPGQAPAPAEVPAGVVPALAGSAPAAPPADPPMPPLPPTPPSWAPPAGQVLDLTDGLAAGDADWSDWSGWWEPSPGDPHSPLAARPPLSERVQRRDTPDPHPVIPGPPNREGSPAREGVAPAVHSPTPSPTPTPAPSAAPTPPSTPSPAPTLSPTTQGAGPGDGLLARRVPQAHLAPELRRNGQAPAASRPDGAGPDADEARAALSRYQASRQAARAVVDDPGPEGQADGGRWS